MARITPSLVVKAIEETYPWTTIGSNGSGDAGMISSDQAANIGMIVSLIDAIPSDLLPTDAQDRLVLLASVGAMRAALTNWASGSHPGHMVILRTMPAIGNRQPVAAARKVLLACPDEAAESRTAAMEFITDEKSRESIRVDASVAHRAAGNGEYKAATVLAGSVIEALLLWRLKQSDPTELEKAALSVSHQRKADGKALVSKRSLEHWVLSDFIDVAEIMSLIDDTTATNLRLSNEYRNLIHPGRVLRGGFNASQATALTALGGMERLIDVFSLPPRP